MLAPVAVFVLTANDIAHFVQHVPHFLDFAAQLMDFAIPLVSGMSFMLAVGAPFYFLGNVVQARGIYVLHGSPQVVHAFVAVRFALVTIPFVMTAFTFAMEVFHFLS